MRTRGVGTGGGRGAEGSNPFRLIPGFTTICKIKLIDPLAPSITLISSQAPHSEFPASLPLSSLTACFSSCLHSGLVMHDSPVPVAHSLPDQCRIPGWQPIPFSHPVPEQRVWASPFRAPRAHHGGLLLNDPCCPGCRTQPSSPPALTWEVRRALGQSEQGKRGRSCVERNLIFDCYPNLDL